MNRKKLLFNWRSLAVFAVIFSVGYLYGIGNLNGHVHEQGFDDIEATSNADDNFAAPDASLVRLDGSSVSLSDYRGKWVLLNFWATWCGPCVREMPSLEKFSKEVKSKNMVVLAVSLDKGDGDVVHQFVDDYKLTFPVFHDPESDVADQFGVGGLPSSYVINPQGEVVAHALGERNWVDPVITSYFTGLMEPEKQKM